MILKNGDTLTVVYKDGTKIVIPIETVMMLCDEYIVSKEPIDINTDLVYLEINTK